MLIAQLSDLHVGGDGDRISVELCVPGGERWSLGDFPRDWPAKLSARRSDPFVRAQRGLSLAEDSGTPPG
jgi:hypothetical protein